MEQLLVTYQNYLSLGGKTNISNLFYNNLKKNYHYI